jgi:hypothetical protein
MGLIALILSKAHPLAREAGKAEMYIELIIILREGL